MLRGQEEKAEQILQRINGAQQATLEVNQIRASLTQTTSRKLLAYGLPVLVIGILLSAFQQLVGIQVMLYYAPEIFKNMGHGADSAMLQTTLVGATNFAFTLVAIYTVDRFGRKPLLLIGSTCMTIFMAILCACFYTQSIGTLSLVGVLGFVASFALSWGPVMWVLLSEMFPNAIRSKALSVAVAVQWITNYTVSSTFPLLDKNTYLVETFHHSVSFGLFGLMALLSLFFVWKFIPETKGRSLEELEQLWTKRH